MKISEVIEKMDEFHQPYTPGKMTRDVILYGDPDIECTGIAVTATANLDVLHKAVENGVNLIISHEGITYNYEKSYNVDEVSNEVLQAKLKFIRDNNLCIWRDHDHMHGGGPRFVERVRADMIFYGTMKELGWEPYNIDDPKKPLWFKIPEKSAEELARELIEKWNLNGLRIVGNRNARISTVFICEHVQGGERDLPIIDNAEKADAMIPLEICDFTLTQYVRDAAYLGKNKVLFEMGHFSAEELGMKYLVKVLPEFFNNELKVIYLQSGDTFDYILRK
ncbi:MAG: Nif3-like dinuclear metal center hexameric protein [Erysipelotrichaceae bacterium]|nr:Nif3-like dinuclear metal center hexameric protein [Erysipelotrichaceae bacterium]